MTPEAGGFAEGGGARKSLCGIRETRAPGWQPIETAPIDYTEVIGMCAKGLIFRTWFFAPSSMTRNWLKVSGGGAWKPIYWMPIPLLAQDRLPELADANNKESQTP